MKNTIAFQYDEKNDIVIATPHWVIATKADAAAWYAQYEAYFSKFQRKMDCVVILDHFEVKSVVGSVWGEYRVKVHRNFTRFTFRVNISKVVRLFVNTSAVRFDGPRDEATTVEEAIQAILAARQAAGVP